MSLALILLGMIDDEGLADAEGVALWMLDEADVDACAGVDMDTLGERLTGHRVRFERLTAGGELRREDDGFHVVVRRSLPAQKQREVAGHELGEWFAEVTGRSFDSLAQREAWCDAVGARLVAPSAAVARIVRRYGHRVHGLAEVFGVSQSLALLRIGEVTGRPVAILGRSYPLVRGAPFVWHRDMPRDVAHPVRVDNRLGWMARLGLF